ncbi:hypothetical protein [Leptolyngbya sp. AN03gr2]
MSQKFGLVIDLACGIQASVRLPSSKYIHSSGNTTKEAENPHL